MYFPGTDIFYSLTCFYILDVYVYFERNMDANFIFLWEKGLSLWILSQQLALTYKRSFWKLLKTTMIQKDAPPEPLYWQQVVFICQTEKNKLME